MSDKPMTPCDGLDLEDRAKRLSAHMYHLGQGTVRLRDTFANRKRVAGYCGLCGSKLAVTWRAVKCLEVSSDTHPNGVFECHEAGHDEASQAALRAVITMPGADNPVRDAYGLFNGFSLQQITACASVDERTFKRANSIVLERAQAVADGAKEDQKKGQRSDRAKRAAAAAGSSEF